MYTLIALFHRDTFRVQSTVEKNGGTVTGSWREEVSWEGGWDIGRGRGRRTAGGGDVQAWPFAALVRGSGHDQTGGLGCEGTTCQERHVKSASAGMQKSELCKPQTHPLVRVPGGGQALRPGPHVVPGTLCLLCGHTLLFSSKKPQSNLPLTLQGLLAPNGSPCQGC